MLAKVILALIVTQAAPGPLATLRSQAAAMTPLVQTQLAKHWLKAASKLTLPEPRTIHKSANWLTEQQYRQLSKEEQAKAKPKSVDGELYYNTKYGTPIAYARAVDLAAQNKLKNIQNAKILDFGYGGIGQLRLFASLGATAVGIDVDPFLKVLYSKPSDQGRYCKGTVKLIDGHFPVDKTTKKAVGKSYDLVVSKNTLKRGYIHPSRPADKSQLIDLGVTDARFLQVMHQIIKPGGLLIIYNLCPAQAPPDKPYIPWADGESPFNKDLFKNAGFEVLKFDQVDDVFARKMARALGWDKDMDLEHDLFAWYTIARRK